MKKTQSYTHPINLYHERIKEEGIIVFDDARGLPTTDGPFVSPDYVICICHRGHMDLLYDDYPDYTEQHSVGVIFPKHALVSVSTTDDYIATLIVADVSVMNDPMLQIINQMRYRYEQHPCLKLDKHEYKMIMNVVELMRETLHLSIPDRRTLMVRQLEFFLRLLSHYRISKLNETSVDKRVSSQFQNNIAQHFREHRDVGFYAEKACLSPKHFSTVIKQETPLPIGFTLILWPRPRCCSIYVATSPCKPSPTCWVSKSKPLSAATSAAKQACRPVNSVKGISP